MPTDFDGRDLVHVWRQTSWNYRLSEIWFLLVGRWIYPFETMAGVHASHVLGKDTTNNFWEWLDNHAIDGGLNY